MTPIEQVRPALPGNWTRRPDPKVKRGGDPGKDKQPGGKAPPGHDPKDGPGEREHILDELA